MKCTMKLVLLVVILTSAATNTNTITLNWTAIDGAKQYRVYGRKAGAEELIVTLPADTLSFTDTGRATPSGAAPTPNGTDRVTPRRGSRTI